MMTDDELRVAIWGKMGYVRKPEFDYPWSEHGTHYMAIMWGDDSGRLTNQDSMPDPLTDLNVCHEMEKMLTSAQLSTYCTVLRPIVEEQGKGGFAYMFTATARQRAEAFARVCFPERFNR